MATAAWLDGKGATHEMVLDLAWSGDRKRDPRSGQVLSAGITVDVKKATWTKTIGTPLLTRFWQDPDFDAAQHAFYYVRVMEIPQAPLDRLRLQGLRSEVGQAGPHDDHQPRLHLTYSVRPGKVRTR
jgi:hypothetical protein